METLTGLGWKMSQNYVLKKKLKKKNKIVCFYSFIRMFRLVLKMRVGVSFRELLENFSSETM